MAGGKVTLSRVVIVVYFVLAVAGLWVVMGQNPAPRPQTQQQSEPEEPESIEEWMCWWESLTPTKKRSILHAALAQPGGHHDVYGSLCEVGDETSVPLLINSLKWQEHSPEGSMV
jgi:hypothetical protein